METHYSFIFSFSLEGNHFFYKPIKKYLLTLSLTNYFVFSILLITHHCILQSIVRKFSYLNKTCLLSSELRPLFATFHNVLSLPLSFSLIFSSFLNFFFREFLIELKFAKHGTYVLHCFSYV